MTYPPPLYVVWETTLACNLHCRYCGSAAGLKRGNELTTKEALSLCHDLNSLGAGRISLMGGEPLLREDLFILLHELKSLKQEAEVITNGLLLDREMALRLREMDIYGVSLSLDGDRDVHDMLRNHKGSYDAVERGVEYSQEAGLYTGILTQLNRDNIHCLDYLYELLISWQVDGWQIQLTAPTGYAKGTECMIGEGDILLLHDWAEGKQAEGRLHFYFADDIGYYHPLEPKIRSGKGRESCFMGCKAGLMTLGIASNGDIKGCLSLPDEFIEDNIRNRPLSQIWNDPNLFAYNRVGHELYGFCKDCVYGQVCRGGCSSFAYSTTGRLGDMRWCWYAKSKPKA